MKSTFEKLARILSMEREQGCPDRVVIGGLGKYLPFWIKLAQEGARSPDLQQHVRSLVILLEGYGVKDRTVRMQAVEQALGILTLAQGQCTDADTLPAVGAEVEPAPAHVAVPVIAPVTAPEPRRPAEAAEARRPAPARPARQAPSQDLDAPVTAVAGVSATYAKRLEKLGVHTVRDLLFLLPRRYDDYTTLRTIDQLKYGEDATILATVWDTKTRQARNSLQITTCILSDRTGTIEVTWFNQPYLAGRLRPGREVVISGRVDEYLGRLTFQSPAWEPLEREQLHTARLVPVHPLTEGIGGRWLRKVIKSALDHFANQVADPLPPAVRGQERLPDLAAALHTVHFPKDQEALQQARRRLCFEEFFLIQLGVLRKRSAWRSRQSFSLPQSAVVERFLASLPFQLTGAQKRVLAQIAPDLEATVPMSRLLQGDVGSGKTVVAVAAMLQAVGAGYQASIMAPTEILAGQHFESICRLIGELTLKRTTDGPEEPVRVALLTGSLKNKEKQQVREAICRGEVDIVIGTHALIQEGVDFARLGLVVIDEQHRFGVEQRTLLRQKGETERVPHMLVMSATPIPRTLALTVYGDLDVAVLDELPPHRQVVETHLTAPRERERAYHFLRKQVEQGHQAFIVCPLIEESDKTEAKAATEEYERLQEEIFPDLRLALLHGRMKGEEKEATMAGFRAGECDILVSTAVVEVGIDVPNATVMMIEGANRFGLAQLHQFRGRVGRGAAQSYCLLLSDSSDEEALQRLHVVEATHDGFALAEEDLKMRGPGEFFGTRQSGLPDLKVATLADGRILEDARRAAHTLFAADPELAQPENRLLRQRVERFWSEDAEPN
jgi:ATP-dependent DNA helicase RecG